MITKEDISSFFDIEAEASRKLWEALMSLSLKERIRKRKAIGNLTLDKNYSDRSPEGENLIRVTVKTNLSDFKEGDCLILHKEGNVHGIECTLYQFEGDNSIVLSVFPLNMPSKLDDYYDEELVLDKNLVDLRSNVYDNFLASVPYDHEFWEKLLINDLHSPTFEKVEECEAELDDTIKNFELNLMPNQREAILNSMTAKDYYLIQGPPGTGKSFVLGLVMLEELVYFKHKIIVIGPNHLAINNALGQVLKMWPAMSGCIIKVGQSYNAPKMTVENKGEEKQITNCLRLPNVHLINNLDGGWIIGLTPHSLYSSRGRGLECDTFVIDEAGQMTISLALMGMVKAKKVILAGDHKQLAPIITSEKMMEYMKKSIFQKLMQNGNFTLLDVSFRMCKPICDFVSDLFYEGKVKAKNTDCGNRILCGNELLDFRHPVIIHHVDDEGEQTSKKEAEFIVKAIKSFLNLGLMANEIGVLSPFRAQAALIRRLIRKDSEIKDEDELQVAVDTIDKMQGQEREVIIVTLVAGKSDYIKDMADFLYNPNKLNVAFSRAKSKLIIVGNINKIREIDQLEYPHIYKMLKSKYVEYM